jgi:hypothetical protein
MWKVESRRGLASRSLPGWAVAGAALLLLAACGGSESAPPPAAPAGPPGLGLLEEGDTTYDGVPAGDGRYEVRPPSSLDLRGLLPVVRSQGMQGSCVGWAVGYYMKTAQEQKEMTWGQGTLDHQFSPAYIYNQRPNAPGSGMYIPDALSIVIDQGCSSLATMPYTDASDTAQPSPAARTEAGNYLGQDQRRIGSSGGLTDIDILDMKTWLFEKGYPIVMGIPVYDTFMQYRGENSGILTNLTGGSYRGGHALAIVGYDDTAAGGSFLIVNSWGTNWGAAGFVWIPYSQLQLVGARVYALLDRPNSITPPPPNPSDTGNDTLAGAGVIMSGETKTGSVGNIADDPADWWKFTVTAGTLAQIDLSGLTSDVDLKLTNAAETRLASSVNYFADDEQIVYTFTTGGTYFIKVYPYDDLQSPYMLTLTTMAGQSNDSPGGATVLAVNTDGTGSVGGTDPRDWWRVDLAGGQPVVMTLTGLSEDIDLYVYDGLSAAQADSYAYYSIEASSDPEYISFTPGAAGTYYLLVVPYVSAQSSYVVRADQGGGTANLVADSFNINYTLYSDRIVATVTSLVVSNDGSGDAGPYQVLMGLSLNNTPGSTYWYRVSGFRWTSTGLPFGFQETWSSGTETIYKAGISPNGTYYVMFHVDPFDAITESNESDNDMYSSARIVPIP